MSTTARIFIVEDHPIALEGFSQIIRQTPGLDLAGSAQSGSEALDQISPDQVDLVLIDLAIPGMDGLELIKRLHALYPELPSLVISAHHEDLYAERALRAGGRGYIMKDEDVSVIREAVHRVLDGDIYLSPSMSTRMMRRFLNRGEDASEHPFDTLSDRELEVFRYIGQGSSTREIADALFLSPKTIESHRANIKRKLDLKSNSDLIRQAVLWAESMPE